MKSLKISKFYSLVLIPILIGALNLYIVFSSLTNNVTIRSSGIITTISPLHVEGRYVKNAINQTVLLKGVNKVEFADDPDGIWMGSTMWTDDNVKAELDAMKSWGINVVRCHISIELWKYNIGPASGHPASPYSAISTREAIKRFLIFAADRGIYVILDPYSVRSYWTGGEQDYLPFPPYQRSPNASEIIGSVDEFVDWWRSVARELKDYPNVMFDLWNEPNPPMEAWSVWLDAAQRCINAIREEGFTGIILFEWRTGVYCNIYADEQTFPQGYPAGGFTLHDWLEDAVANLTDPLGNLAFDVHLYRQGGFALFRGDMQQQLQDYWNSTQAWEYNQLKMAMEYMGWKWAVETVNVPLIVGETGASLGWGDNPIEQQNELTAWDNWLTILDEWGIGYVAFWWREIGIYRLHNGPPNFIPTESAQVLLDLLKKTK